MPVQVQRVSFSRSKLQYTGLMNLSPDFLAPLIVVIIADVYNDCIVMRNINRAIIFSNGNLTDISQAASIIGESDFIICADGGVKSALKAGFSADVIIGDFDSYRPPKGSGGRANLLRFPCKKDKTDFELATSFALAKKASEIVIFGLLGDRLDHLTANLMHLANIKMKRKSPEIKIIEGKTVGYLVREQISLAGKIGDELSIIPLIGGNLKVTKTEGLEYKPDGSKIGFGSTRGVSNVFRKDKVEIKTGVGVCLVFHRKLK